MKRSIPLHSEPVPGTGGALLLTAMHVREGVEYSWSLFHVPTGHWFGVDETGPGCWHISSATEWSAISDLVAAGLARLVDSGPGAYGHVSAFLRVAPSDQALSRYPDPWWVAR